LSNEEKKESVFEQFAWKFIERGISVVPIAPGSKKPGQWSQEHGWRGMGDWTRFAKRVPTDIELEHWYAWPDAGIGVVLGEVSNLTCLDKDYDIPNGGNDALQAIIPWSPIAKKGEKGWTRFYQFNGERSCSFDVGGARVLDVLAEGRQTVIPPTVHPSGCSYVWITEESLDSILTTNELPKLPSDFLEQVARVLAPYQTEPDIKHQKKTTAPRDDADRIDTSLSIQGEYFRDLNRAALDRLDEWVPKIIPTAKTHNDGYRCVATWRGVKNPNVGINSAGIRDWGGGYGMTATDLVMYANGLTFQKAAEALRACLALNEPAPINMTVGGSKAAPAPAPSTPVPTPPITLPWLKPAAPVAPVMLPPDTSFDPAPAIPAFITNPPGILGEVARWITATAPKQQPELSVAAAIALGSVIMGRTYRSQYGNFTSLYMVMVAKSTEGKEHPQGSVEKILTSADLSKLIGGSGYTSAGAVFSALLDSPAHLATIDELGKLLKMSRANGQAHSEAAIDKLIEAFGRLDGVMRPPTYSKMTLSKSQTSNVERVVHNPAISLLGATTPGTFYAALTNDLVQDGFLGRCIVVESKQPRQLTRFVDRTEPPKRIIEWCKAVHVSGAVQGNLVDVTPSDMPATIVGLDFDESCMPMMQALESELNDEKEAGEGEGLDVILGRTMEKSMRLAMIVAKAVDPHARKVLPVHLEWAIQYVRHYDLELIRSVRRERVASQTDADIKRAVKFIKAATKYSKDARFGKICSQGGMPHSKLLKLMAMPARQFKELMETAAESGVITKSPGVQWDYAADVYFAVDGE
jgi:hypothetical protein